MRSGNQLEVKNLASLLHQVTVLGAWAAVRKHHRPWLVNRRGSFLTVLEAGRPRSRGGTLVSGRTRCLGHRWLPSQCLAGQEERGSRLYKGMPHA